MIAVDTNILVYAHRADLPLHDKARAAIERLVATREPWAIPWPVAHEFVAMVTGRAFGAHRTPRILALETIASWLAHPSCRTIGETATHWSVLDGLVRRAEIDGGAVHDARIAAICLAHGVAELWTVDRDFARFPDLRTRNPFVASLQEPAPAPYGAPLRPRRTRRNI